MGRNKWRGTGTDENEVEQDGHLTRGRSRFIYHLLNMGGGGASHHNEEEQMRRRGGADEDS